MAGLDAATRVVSRKLEVGSRRTPSITSGASWPSAAASAYAADVRQVAARAEHAVVQLGVHPHRLGAHRRPQPLDDRDRLLAAVRGRADHAALAFEQQRARRVGADPFGAGDRVAGDVGARAQLGLDGGDRRRLHAADVEHQRAVVQLGRDLRRGVAQAAHRRRQHHDRGPARRLAGGRRGAIDDAQRLRALQLLLGAAPGDDLGDRARDARAQRHRAADLPDADDRHPPQRRS